MDSGVPDEDRAQGDCVDDPARGIRVTGRMRTMTIKMGAATRICLATCLIVRAFPCTADDKCPIAKEPVNLRSTILALDDLFWEAASRHDVETLSRLFADDYSGIDNDGTRWTKATMLDQHQMARLGDLKGTSERELIQVGDHAALLTYDARFNVFTRDGVLRDKAYQRLLSCWVQRDGGWFVRFSQVTDLAGTTTQPQPSDHQADRQTGNPEGSKEGNEQGKPGTGKTTVISLRDVIVDEVDAGHNTITVTIGRKKPLGDEAKVTRHQEGKVGTVEPTISTKLVNLPVTKDAEIRISSRHFPSVANNVQRVLSELKPGMPASLELTVCEDETARPIVVSKIVGWREP
jgi:hypothetical protein